MMPSLSEAVTGNSTNNTNSTNSTNNTNNTNNTGKPGCGTTGDKGIGIISCSSKPSQPLPGSAATTPTMMTSVTTDAESNSPNDDSSRPRNFTASSNDMSLEDCNGVNSDRHVRADPEEQPISVSANDASWHMELLFGLFLQSDETELARLAEKVGKSSKSRHNPTKNRELVQNSRTLKDDTNAFESSSSSSLSQPLALLPEILSTFKKNDQPPLVSKKATPNNGHRRQQRQKYESLDLKETNDFVLQSFYKNVISNNLIHDPNFHNDIHKTRRRRKPTMDQPILKESYEPISLKYNECSFAAIASWAVKKPGSTGMKDKRNNTNRQSRNVLNSVMVYRPASFPTFKTCGVCHQIGHYEVECREINGNTQNDVRDGIRGVKNTLPISNENKKLGKARRKIAEETRLQRLLHDSAVEEFVESDNDGMDKTNTSLLDGQSNAIQMSYQKQKEVDYKRQPWIKFSNANSHDKFKNLQPPNGLEVEYDKTSDNKARSSSNDRLLLKPSSLSPLPQCQKKEENKKDEDEESKTEECKICHTDYGDGELILCDGCDGLFHQKCLEPPLEDVPEGDWFCQVCKGYDSDVSSTVEIEGIDDFVIEQRKISSAQKYVESRDQCRGVGFWADEWDTSVCATQKNLEENSVYSISPNFDNQTELQGSQEADTQGTNEAEKVKTGELCWARRRFAQPGKAARDFFWPCIFQNYTSYDKYDGARYLVRPFCIYSTNRFRATDIVPFFPNYEKHGCDQIEHGGSHEHYHAFVRGLKEALKTIGITSLEEALLTARNTPSVYGHNMNGTHQSSSSVSSKWANSDCTKVDDMVIFARSDKEKPPSKEPTPGTKEDKPASVKSNVPLADLLGNIVAFSLDEDTCDSSVCKGKKNQLKFRYGVVDGLNTSHGKVLVRQITNLDERMCTIGAARTESGGEEHNGNGLNSADMHATSLGVSVWVPVQSICNLADSASFHNQQVSRAMIMESLRRERKRIHNLSTKAMRRGEDHLRQLLNSTGESDVDTITSIGSEGKNEDTIIDENALPTSHENTPTINDEDITPIDNEAMIPVETSEDTVPAADDDIIITPITNEETTREPDKDIKPTNDADMTPITNTKNAKTTNVDTTAIGKQKPPSLGSDKNTETKATSIHNNVATKAKSNVGKDESLKEIVADMPTKNVASEQATSEVKVPQSSNDKVADVPNDRDVKNVGDTETTSEVKVSQPSKAKVVDVSNDQNKKDVSPHAGSTEITSEVKVSQPSKAKVADVSDDRDEKNVSPDTGDKGATLIETPSQMKTKDTSIQRKEDSSSAKTTPDDITQLSNSIQMNKLNTLPPKVNEKNSLQSAPPPEGISKSTKSREQTIDGTRQKHVTSNPANTLILSQKPKNNNSTISSEKPVLKIKLGGNESTKNSNNASTLPNSKGLNIKAKQDEASKTSKAHKSLGKERIASDLKSPSVPKDLTPSKEKPIRKTQNAPGPRLVIRLPNPNSKSKTDLTNKNSSTSISSVKPSDEKLSASTKKAQVGIKLVVSSVEPSNDNSKKLPSNKLAVPTKMKDPQTQSKPSTSLHLSIPAKMRKKESTHKTGGSVSSDRSEHEVKKTGKNESISILPKKKSGESAVKRSGKVSTLKPDNKSTSGSSAVSAVKENTLSIAVSKKISVDKEAKESVKDPTIRPLHNESTAPRKNTISTLTENVARKETGMDPVPGSSSTSKEKARKKKKPTTEHSKLLAKTGGDIKERRGSSQSSSSENRSTKSKKRRRISTEVDSAEEGRHKRKEKKKVLHDSDPRPRRKTNEEEKKKVLHDSDPRPRRKSNEEEKKKVLHDSDPRPRRKSSEDELLVSYRTESQQRSERKKKKSGKSKKKKDSTAKSTEKMDQPSKKKKSKRNKLSSSAAKDDVSPDGQKLGSKSKKAHTKMSQRPAQDEESDDELEFGESFNEAKTSSKPRYSQRKRKSVEKLNSTPEPESPAPEPNNKKRARRESAGRDSKTIDDSDLDMDDVDNEEIFIAEGVLAERSSNGFSELLIKWKDFPKSEATWEPQKKFQNSDFLRSYHVNKIFSELRKKNEARDKTTPTARAVRVLRTGLKVLVQNENKPSKSKVCMFCMKKLGNVKGVGAHLRSHASEDNYDLIRKAIRISDESWFANEDK